LGENSIPTKSKVSETKLWVLEYMKREEGFKEEKDGVRRAGTNEP